MTKSTLICAFIAILAIFNSGCSIGSNGAGASTNITRADNSGQQQQQQADFNNKSTGVVLKQQAAGSLPMANQTNASYPVNDPNIRPGMKISISSVEDQNINGKFQVDFNGDLKLPYNVVIQAAGQTLPELKSSLQSAYAPFFRFPPTLRVSLADRKQMVEVQGLVTNPGKVLLNADSSLDELISESGGLGGTEELGGTPRYIRVIPAEGESFAVALRDYYAGVSPVSFRWRGGDRVFFQSEKPSDLIEGATIERQSVQLIGQIIAPGAYPYRDGENFFHYLVLAGGPTERSDFQKIEVVRIKDNKRDSKVYNLSRKNVLPDIQAGDIVIVHAQRESQTIPHATGILSSIATAILAATSL
jgi:protein involved in polysaccharide export with SLBB domain